MKKSVLFVANHLTVGGVQKSLISALESINYDHNDVTLYIRKRRLDLLPYINKNVRVIINNDSHHYYRHPKALFLHLMFSFCKFFNITNGELKYKKKLADTIRIAMSKYEFDTYFADNKYDVAISYWQGYNTSFVDEYIEAKKKIMFYQVATDELHEVHEKVMPHYDRIVVEHEDIKNSLCSWYDNIEDKIFVLDNYTNPQLLKEMSKENEVQKNPEGVTLCTCARFAEVKGIDLAVKTAKVLKERRINFLWYLVGDGPLRSKIEELINEYQLSENIVLAGMQKNPYPYMCASDIYVQPSYEEALSIAMLESQVLCVPMISTKTAGGIAMVKDGYNGYLADIDENSLADAIEKMIFNNDIREKMKANLSGVDYSKEQKRYVEGWRELLEV